MGSKHSKHGKNPRVSHRDLANQAAARLNAQLPIGEATGHSIAVAVPNKKDPLVVMLRKNEAGEYKYDQEFYDTPFEHRPHRPHGAAARQRDKQRRQAKRQQRQGGVEPQARKAEERAPPAVQGAQAGRVYVPVNLPGAQGAQDQGHAVVPARGPWRKVDGGGPGEHGRSGGHGDGARSRPAKGEIAVDKARHAWVRRKH